MNTHDSTVAASLDVSQAHDLAQLSEEAFWNYAHELAGIIPTMREQSPTESIEEYLECVCGQERFLLPLSALYEIVPPPHRYTSLPGKPVWVSGLAAWRGTAIVVVDLTLYLTGDTGRMHEDPSPESLLIAHADDVSPGLLVHSNSNIIRTSDILPLPFDDTAAANTPAWYMPVRRSLITGMHADAIVLNVPALLAGIVRQLEIAATHG